ncbi:polysaccharide deacetylase family protein [Caldanaerobius polysaccharolyticus]|uniref:polysaccharide deacetylase family protein n=1 Tax=Caldanaerobius polysaccharolyticus TaxID=44256 RepID=UPI00068E4B74|nr:polysaccharide deacetylase family protein [Caldanaerobius polysaccharolyticus]
MEDRAKKYLLVVLFITIIAFSAKTFMRTAYLTKKAPAPLHKPTSYALEVPVLGYHAFASTSQEYKYRKNAYVLPIELFDKQMKYLYENGYKTVTLPDLEGFLEHKKLLPPKSVAITMDDGYENNYTLAYPILKKYRFNATVFIIGAYIRKDGTKSKSPFPLLTYSEMRNSEDVFSFGYHTYNLHRVIHHKPALIMASRSQILNDLEEEKQLFSSYNWVPYLAYPYGRYNDNVIQALKKAGIRMAFTTTEGDVKPGDNPYTLKRHMITPYVSMDEFKVMVGNGSYEEKLKVRFRHILSRVHKVIKVI